MMAAPSFLQNLGDAAVNGLSFCVFAFLDVVDQLLCPVFAILDALLDSDVSTVCYCRSQSKGSYEGHQPAIVNKELTRSCKAIDGPFESWWRSSDTLNASLRRSAKARLHLLTLHRSLSSEEKSIWNDGLVKDLSVAKTHVPEKATRDGRGVLAKIKLKIFSGWRDLRKQSGRTQLAEASKRKQVARWSDCGCQSCTSWHSDCNQLLHVIVDDKDVISSSVNIKIAENNVIFLHGFLSSAQFWADTVMPALPESVRSNYRLFAVDILGFGRSPKPSTSQYTISEHLDMIQKSVIEPHGIQSFHLVAHSMGCTIALAVGAHYSSALKSMTLIAPPYFPATPGTPPATHVMQQLAVRRIWPLITFGSSVMSWYEHIGRVVCFVICKNHRLWEPALYFIHSKLPGKRLPLSCVTDFTKHTHHSAWHIFHNTICNGGSAADRCLEVLLESGRSIRVIHGTKDSIIPYSGSVNLSKQYPNVFLTSVDGASHGTIIFGREHELAQELAKEILSAEDRD